MIQIRSARAEDLPVLQDIERAAGECFRTIDMPEIADDEPPSIETLAHHLHEGMAWVATDPRDVPVAYLIADMVDGCLHVEQVSVHSRWGHQGIGRRLLEHLREHAMVRGVRALTLTTFADVPWNAPYYVRCGFRMMGEGEIGPGLRVLREREAAMGFDKWPRVCMVSDLTSG